MSKLDNVNELEYKTSGTNGVDNVILAARDVAKEANGEFL